MSQRWETVQGAVSREGKHTAFRVSVLTSLPNGAPGTRCGQAIFIENDRLEANPGLYARTLGWMIRDLEVYGPCR